jgi:hypothetical protein
MRSLARTILLSAAAAAAATVALSFNERGSSFISEAQAVIGRPLTPMSYAGVARRTTRRAVAVGTAAGAYGAYGAYGPGCVQVVDAYGRVVTRCR